MDSILLDRVEGLPPELPQILMKFYVPDAAFGFAWTRGAGNRR
jgi:hypothetical protein